MKRKIRKSVFETNSSSQHSLIYKHNNRKPSELEVDPTNNFLVVHVGDFTEKRKELWTQKDKLGYLFTYRIIKDGYQDYMSEIIMELLETDSRYSWNKFSSMERCLLDYTNCSGIKLVKDEELRMHVMDNAEFAEEMFYDWFREDDFLDFVFDDNIGIDLSFD